MNRKHIQYVSAAVIVAALFFSCSKPTSTVETTQTQQNNPPQNNDYPPAGNCTMFAEAAVVKVSGSSTAQVNREIILTVDYGVINGCGGFGSFETAETDFNYNITLIAKYDGCVCTANAPVLKTIYKFTPAKAGVYYFKFKNGIRQPIVHQVTVGGMPGS